MENRVEFRVRARKVSEIKVTQHHLANEYRVVEFDWFDSRGMIGTRQACHFRCVSQPLCSQSTLTASNDFLGLAGDLIFYAIISRRYLQGH